MRGGDVYAAELAQALADVGSNHQFRLFGYFYEDYRRRRNSIPLPQAPNFAYMIRRWPQRVVNVIERNFDVPLIDGYLRMKGIDLYHSTGPALPNLRWTRSVVTFHDLIPYARPELVAPESVPVWQKNARDCAERASIVLASSTATKLDLMRFLGIPENKIRVALLGVRARDFHPVEKPADLERVRATYRLARRFILSIGPYEPRRNWEGIMRAVASMPKADAPHIVFTGKLGAAQADHLNRLARELGLENSTSFVGYVPRADLAALYNLAEAFVYPCFYDGFNLPIIEAMACGTPVVASAAGALGEIAGGAARVVGPGDVSSIARGIGEALAGGRQDEHVARGLARARELTWEKTALATLDAYEAAATGL